MLPLTDYSTGVVGIKPLSVEWPHVILPSEHFLCSFECPNIFLVESKVDSRCVFQELTLRIYLNRLHWSRGSVMSNTHRRNFKLIGREHRRLLCLCTNKFWLILLNLTPLSAVLSCILILLLLLSDLHECILVSGGKFTV